MKRTSNCWFWRRQKLISSLADPGSSFMNPKYPGVRETSWSGATQCFPDCFPNLPRPSMPVSQTLSLNFTSIESPIEKQSVEIPECYAHFSDVFCPTKASQLPPHRPWDCAIDLLPGESVPKGKIYPLSLPEQKAMEEYIEEALQQGYIRPSMSPAASFSLPKRTGAWGLV